LKSKNNSWLLQGVPGIRPEGLREATKLQHRQLQDRDLNPTAREYKCEELPPMTDLIAILAT